MVNTDKTIFKESPLTFGVDLSEVDDRLDCAWFNPIVIKKIEELKTKKSKNRKLVKLRIVADINGGKRLPKGTIIQDDDLGVIPYVRSMDVKNLRVNVNSAAKITKEIHQEIQNYQLKKDDVVITIVGAKIGEVGIVEDKIEVCDFTENVARIRIKNSEEILPKFLLYFLNSSFGRMQTERFSVGSLQYKLSLQGSRNIEVYLPVSDDKFNIKEQQEILKSINSILGQAYEHRKNRQNFIEQAQSVIINKLEIPLIQESQGSKVFEVKLEGESFSRLDALFNNPLHEKLLSILKKYPHKSLGSLTKPDNDNSVMPTDFYRLVGLEQIDEITGKITKPLEVPELGSEKILLKKGTIIISKLQPEKGKIAIVQDEFGGAVGSSELVPLILTSEEVSLDYLWIVLRSNYVLNQWEYQLTGSSRMRIGPNEIESTIIPIPTLELQKEIVKEVAEKITKSENELSKELELYKEAQDLFENLLIKEI